MVNERVRRQRRPFLIPIWLVGIAGAAAFAMALFLIWVWATADSTAIVVALAPASGTAGEARAAALARLISGDRASGHVDVVYISSTPRNPALGSAWAAQLSKLPTVFAGEGAKALAKRALREHSGGRVLIIADAQMAQSLVKLLSGTEGAVSGDGDPGALYVINVPRIGNANLLRLNY